MIVPELRRLTKYVAFAFLSSVFFLLMIELLPSQVQSIPSFGLVGFSVATPDTISTSSQIALFSLVVVALSALLIIHDHRSTPPRIQQFEQLMRKTAYAIRSRNLPKSEQLYRKLYKSYHKLAPQSHDYKDVIHVLHKEMVKLQKTT